MKAQTGERTAQQGGERHEIDVRMHIRFKGTLEDADMFLGQLKYILQPSILTATVHDVTSEKEWEKP